MTRVLSIISWIATKRGFAILSVLYAIVFGCILATLYQLTALTGGTGILDFDQGYSFERVNNVFDSYGKAGFALYGRIQLLDLINPALYSLIMAGIVYRLWATRKQAWMALLPLTAGILDYCENLVLFMLARNYPDISPLFVTAGSSLSIAKNVALFAAILSLSIGFVLWVMEKRSNTRS